MDLEVTATAAAAAMAKTIKSPVGPDDLSAYNLEDYDEEESKGAGTCEYATAAQTLIERQPWAHSATSRVCRTTATTQTTPTSRSTLHVLHPQRFS